MHIGLFGGTFNPIHQGHLWAASQVKKGFNLDQIFLIPAAIPPHKTPGTVASAADRLAMINLAVADAPGITVSDVELNRWGPSYTIDTVYHFKHTFAADTRIYLIMGLDAFLDLDTWKSYKKLLEEVAFIVIARPNDIYSDARQGWQVFEDYLKSKLSADYEFSAAHNCYMSKGWQPIHICDVKALDISSTDIRKRVNKGQSIESLVPPMVAEFIKSKGLYR